MPEGIRVHRRAVARSAAGLAALALASALAGCGAPPPAARSAAAAGAPSAQSAPAPQPAPAVREVKRTVAPGDTLERIFRDAGLGPGELAALRADPQLRRRVDRILSLIHI